MLGDSPAAGTAHGPRWLLVRALHKPRRGDPGDEVLQCAELIDKQLTEAPALAHLCGRLERKRPGACAEPPPPC